MLLPVILSEAKDLTYEHTDFHNRIMSDEVTTLQTRPSDVYDVRDNERSFAVCAAQDDKQKETPQRS